MIGFLKNALRRFRDDDAGSAVIPFALWTPLMVGMALSAIEMGALTVRQTALERALDQTVREVKLGTGVSYSHEELKLKICDQAPVLGNCEEMLHLEMIGLDMRDWQPPSSQADCVDTAMDVTPQRSFVHGKQHETMLLRACYRYKPISPTSYLAGSLEKDTQGYTALVSTSAFVHEPL